MLFSSKIAALPIRRSVVSASLVTAFRRNSSYSNVVSRANTSNGNNPCSASKLSEGSTHASHDIGSAESVSKTICKGNEDDSTAAASSPPPYISNKQKKKGTQHPGNNNGTNKTTHNNTADPHQSQKPFSCGWFVAHRAKTLADLEANENDKSNAGRVDPLILPTVRLINSYPHFCTASSCSGRVSVFHRAMPSPKSPPSNLATKTATASGGGEGEGAHVVEGTVGAPHVHVEGGDDVSIANKKRGAGVGTVFSSHDPLTDTRAVAEEVYKALVREGVPTTRTDAANADSTTCTCTSPHALSELLQVKFEPTILHTTCATIADAHRFVAAASESGHRITGIGISKVGRAAARADDAAASAASSPAVASLAGADTFSSSAADAAAEGSSAEEATMTAEQGAVSAFGEGGSGEEDSAAGSGVGLGLLAGNDGGWKITAKMQSMVCFDAPLYTATAGWSFHGGHDRLPDVFGVLSTKLNNDDKAPACHSTNEGVGSALPTTTTPTTCTDADRDLAEGFIASVDRFLQHANALFVENAIRRERFNETLKVMEEAAAAKAAKEARRRRGGRPEN